MKLLLLVFSPLPASAFALWLVYVLENRIRDALACPWEET